MSTLTYRQKKINESIKACHPIRKVKGDAHQVLPCQVDAHLKTEEEKKKILSMHKNGMSVEKIMPFICKVSDGAFDLTEVELLRVGKTRKLIEQTIKENK